MRALILLLLLTGCQTVAAQAPVTEPAAAPVCGPAIPLMQGITARYGEIPIGIGATENGTAVFMVSDRMSWTILHITPDGVACVLAGGDAWQPVMMDAGTPS